MALLELLVQPLPVEGILAHDHRLQIVDQGLAVQMRPATGPSQEGVALDAFVRGDCEEAHLGCAAEFLAQLAVRCRRDVVPCEEGEG